MRIWFILLICVAASLLEPAMLEDRLEDGEGGRMDYSYEWPDSQEDFDPHYSADEVLQHILDLLNDFVNYYAPTSYPVNAKLNGTNFYGSKVWGINLGTPSGEVKNEASLIIVKMEFPYMQFSLFADSGDEEGIVTAKLYDLDIRTIIYFDEDMNIFHYMDTYVHGYAFMAIENADGDGKKNDLKLSVDETDFIRILTGSLKEIENIFDFFRSTDFKYKFRKFLGNRTELRNLNVGQMNKM